jgi:hypothetical protein
MAEYTHRPGDEYREAKPALVMLDAFRKGRPSVTGNADEENLELKAEMLKLAESGNLEDSIDAVMRRLRGFIQLASILVEFSAAAAGLPADEIMSVTRQGLEEKIAEHGGA